MKRLLSLPELQDILQTVQVLGTLCVVIPVSCTTWRPTKGNDSGHHIPSHTCRTHSPGLLSHQLHGFLDTKQVEPIIAASSKIFHKQPSCLRKN